MIVKKFLDFIRLPLVIFLIWRVLLFLIAFAGVLMIPRFGNMYPYANTVLEPTGLPAWIWGFGGFDGVHYLRLAQNGYSDAFYQAFFPFYPVLIRIINVFPKDSGLNTTIFVDRSFFYAGIVLSNLFLLASLVLLRKISKKEDYLWSVMFLLPFPTAFYFGAVYTESLFLFLLLLFVYFLKKEDYLISGIVAALASSTRVIGILFLPILLIKVCRDRPNIKSKTKTLLGLLLAPMGLVSYIVFLWKRFGDPLLFMTSQPGFGAGRSALPIITLPQVFFRYLKMFITVKNGFQFLTITNEFIFSLVILIFILWAYKKVEFSLWLLSLLIYLAPTLTGTLSSMPRYVIFSYVLLIPALFSKPYKLKVLLISVMAVMQMMFLIMFTRGFWVA